MLDSFKCSKLLADLGLLPNNSSLMWILLSAVFLAPKRRDSREKRGWRVLEEFHWRNYFRLKTIRRSTKAKGKIG